MLLFGSNTHRLLLFTFILQFLPSYVWNGFACLSNPCIHGVCLDDLNSSYFCYCIDGYTGIQCQTNWNECWSSPCQNGGICIDGIAMFDCSCPPGYVGNLCEEDFNECESNPCLNNGTCVDISNGYTCNCIAGYSGVHCEVDVAVCNATEEARCFNGGVCVEGPGDTFRCNCQPGWGGFLCDREVDECMSAPCQNGGICIDKHAYYECACLFGFTGKNCEEVVQICSRNPCRNGALCLIEEVKEICYCVPDFHGELCQFQYDECQLGPKCLNGGTCIDGIDNSTCSCPPNLTGVRCECRILSETELDCSYIATTTSTTSTEEPKMYTITSTTEEQQTTESDVPNITVTSITTISTSLLPITEQSSEYSTPTEIYWNISGSTVPTEISTEVRTFSELYTETTSIIETSTVIEGIVTSTISQTSVYSEEGEEETTSPIISTEVSVYYTTPEITTDFLSSTSAKLFEYTTTEAPTISLEAYTPTTTDFIVTTKTPIIPIMFTTTSSSVIDYITTDVVTSSVMSTRSDKEMNRTFPEVTSTLMIPSIITDVSSQETTENELITKLIQPETTTSFFVDCTDIGKNCQNGGTCVFADLTHRCLCPFDAEGSYCEVKLGIRRAAFNGNSYLLHRLTDTSHLSIEFEAKTLSNNGILFYANVDNSYMTLYIKDGYLQFKFSCGYQTMLLSELNVPVNTGNTMDIKAVLEFSKDFNHCDATIKINNSLSMTGDQIANINRLVSHVGYLYLGGIPQLEINQYVHVGGFIGCLFNLSILGRKVDIYKDAEDGNEVHECSSLVCLSNPCQNGASCISNGDVWSCQCRNGYLGKSCEFSICDNNPCLYGGTCIPFSSSGYICLCPYGKHGHFCENDLKINEPYFSSTVRGWSSFAAYDLPEGISNTMEISFRFTPTTLEQISILVFIGQNGYHDNYSDHLVVSFVKGYIMLTWNLGSGPRRIFSSHPIEKGARDYHVQVGYLGRRAWLYVENVGNFTGRSPGLALSLDVVPQLFLGGHGSRNFSSLPHDLPMHTGFSGCIFDTNIKSGNIKIPIQGTRTTIGRAVGQCGTTECYEQSCQNGGACLHHGSTFMCLCQDNWFGPLCSSEHSFCGRQFSKCSEDSRCVPTLSDYECDCPLSKSGKYCSIDQNLTDVSLTGKRSYIALKQFNLDNTKFNIEMEIRTLKDHGILLYVGQKSSSFICVSIQNSLLELRVQSGTNKSSSPFVVRSSKLLVKGRWHKIQIGIYGRKLYLYADHIINVGILNHGYVLNIFKEIIYLGGLPDNSLVPPLAAPIQPIPYKGCIRNMYLDEKYIALTSDNIQSSRNVIDCDGTPCGGETCLHGGTCWLDSFMKSHCACVPPYYGDKCENIPICISEKSCKNNGKCNSESKCSCTVGYGGAFCEKEITVNSAAFAASSYLVVEKLTDKRRNARSMDLSELYLNFSTPMKDGLMIWSQKDPDFIGVGLENGYIKLVYSPTKYNKTVVHICPQFRVNDGLWHTLKISLSPLQIQIDKIIVPFIHHDDEIINNIATKSNGIFYIGGMPLSFNLLKETNGQFSKNFQGCIESFSTDTSSSIISDFNGYVGIDISSCGNI